MKQITIIGLGYIGLPTALIAANNNFLVAGYDIDKNRVEALTNKICPIAEPGIQELLTNTTSFTASTTIQKADCFIIAVPTPFFDDKTPDLRYVFAAGKTLATQLRTGNTVILESTCPVGTTHKLAKLLEEQSGLRVSKDFYLAYCPERVLPGKIIHELVNNDRIIGGICPESAKQAQNFYKAFVKGECFITNDKTAEMVKLVENSSRDIQIALANQIASMAEQANIDPFEVIALANKHPRVNILQPGCGVGGHCIAVDPWFLITGFPNSSSLLKTAREINDNKPYIVIQKVIDAAKKFDYKPQVLALGLTFKPDTDDLRQSPALFIAQELNKYKNILEFYVYDPFINTDTIKQLYLTQQENLLTALTQADIILILVKHSEFVKNIKEISKIKNIIDPCGLLHGSFYETAFFRKGDCKGTDHPNSST